MNGLREAVAAAIKSATKGQQRAHDSKHMRPAHGPNLVLSRDEVVLVAQDVRSVLAYRERYSDRKRPPDEPRLALLAKCDAALSSSEVFRTPIEPLPPA